MTLPQPDYQTPERMAAKLRAVPLPADLSGKSVLDVGCDMAAWSFLCVERGAVRVVGVDRNRYVRGAGFVDLLNRNYAEAESRGLTSRCNIDFRHRDLGKCWYEIPGRFDLILCLSMYHHWFENCGDHRGIWFWLHRHCAEGAQVLWEGPVDDRDPVVRANVSDLNRADYTRDAILAAGQEYFKAEFIGPALHEPTREVWRFKPLLQPRRLTQAVINAGAGGATAAFQHDNGRRIAEIESILGMKPVAGSLNLRLDGPFDWDRGYVRARVLDVTDRSLGMDSAWSPRWARFYPLTIDEVPAWSFRFEGERYDLRFMELIAPVKLRDKIKGPRVTLAR